MSEERLELARGQGATELRLGGPDTVDWILEQTGGFGADSRSRRPASSHELTLDEVNRGFELMEAQDGIRSVIRFG